ncbi:hypothetical protein ACP70R_000853 [Stipagrostis hirtigluma subsp. patula]
MATAGPTPCLPLGFDHLLPLASAPAPPPAWYTACARSGEAIDVVNHGDDGAAGAAGGVVDGIKSRLRAGGGKRGGGAAGRKAAMASAAGYDKVEKTESMRVEIRSRQARKLIAKNLVAADSIARARAGGNKRFFLAF